MELYQEDTQNQQMQNFLYTVTLIAKVNKKRTSRSSLFILIILFD